MLKFLMDILYPGRQWSRLSCVHPPKGKRTGTKGIEMRFTQTLSDSRGPYFTSAKNQVCVAKRSLYRLPPSPCRPELQVWGVVFAVLWRYLVLIKFLPGEWERRKRWDETLPAQSGIYGNQFCCSRFSQALWSVQEKHSTCVSMWMGFVCCRVSVHDCVF